MKKKGAYSTNSRGVCAFAIITGFTDFNYGLTFGIIGLIIGIIGLDYGIIGLIFGIIDLKFGIIGLKFGIIRLITSGIYDTAAEK